MAEMNMSGFNNDNSTFTANLSDVRHSESTSFVHEVIWYVVLVLGIPGNILSAMVWCRRGLSSNNSSAVYLAALAINDLAYLTFGLVQDFICSERDSLCYSCLYLLFSAFTFEPLLVLGFSIERLIAITRPLQVRCVSSTGVMYMCMRFYQRGGIASYAYCGL